MRYRRNLAAADPVNLERWHAGEPGAAYPLPLWLPILSGVVGATIAVAFGRRHTKLDNTLIGGLFTGFASYRDPRETVASTLLVAAVEGAIWGITDRSTPHIKNWLMPPEHDEPELGPEPESDPLIA